MRFVPVDCSRRLTVADIAQLGQAGAQEWLKGWATEFHIRVEIQIMNRVLRKYWYLSVVSLLVFASASFAQNPASMDLTGVNGASLGPAYTDPYYATINNVPTTVICDDFADESFLNTPWSANETNLTSAGTSALVKWEGGSAAATQTLYDEIAFLSIALLGAAPGQAQEDYSYALWQLTCTQSTGANIGNTCGSKLPFSYLSGTDLTNATNDLNAALNATYTTGEYSNVEIYTPVAGSSPVQQEFIVVTPESSSVVLLGADMLGLLALAFVFRRRLLLPGS